MAVAGAVTPGQCAAFDPAPAPFPLVDCAGICVEAIVARALGEQRLEVAI
jgi:hypothetical protein